MVPKSNYGITNIESCGIWSPVKGKTCIQSQTFINDAAKIWNNAPSDIKECKSIYAAKKQIKIYIQSLPI